MELKAIQNTFHKELDAIYGKEEVSSFFYILIDFYFNLTKIKLALNPKIAINKTDSNLIIEALNRLKKQEPIQYIIGETEFFGLRFKVNKDTLIPRPETEELVQWILDNTNKNKELVVLDIGTGTGCIAISLAKHLPKARVFAIDISAEALQVAKQNAILNNVKISFFKRNILETKRIQINNNLQKFHLIVSNPPYVRNLEKTGIQANVLNNEPHLALFVEDKNPLQFYKTITNFSIDSLKENGQLFFEINEYLGEETKALLKPNTFEAIQLKKDIFGKNRMLKAQLRV